jgi:epoxyqueuosine reductase QueG
MQESLKDRVVQHLKQAGAYDVRIADPACGFEHAIPGRHPLELWQECRSVIVFAVAMATQALLTYEGPYSPSLDANTMRFGGAPEMSTYGIQRLAHLFVANISFWGAAFLQEHHYTVFLQSSGLPGLCGYYDRPLIQAKLCAYESGLGVYGRSGIILHPDLGNRLTIGVLLTDAILAPDPRLSDFAPCKTCTLCCRVCPGNAFDPNTTYPDSWSREKCSAGKAKTQAQGLKCEACFSCCPAGTLHDQDLLYVEHRKSFYEATKGVWRTTSEQD